MKQVISLGIFMLLAIVTLEPGYGIGIEPHKPGAKPSWWNEYKDKPPVQVEPAVQTPVGEVPGQKEEAVTRNALPQVPGQLVITPADQQPPSQIPDIQGEQALRTIEQEARQSHFGIWRNIGWFLGFLLLSVGIVTGAFRWLSNQTPSPSRRQKAW